MHPLAAYTHDFEGEALVTITYDGKPAWVARHIGVRLGYSHGGKRLPNKILGDWKDEFIEGVDYAFLTGEELAALKEATGVVSPNVHNSLLVLFESGLWMVLVKTRRAVGKRLRRFLVEQVLPQIGRTGEYSPELQVVGGVVVSLEVTRPVEGLASRRESRLSQQAQTRERWVDLCDRKLKVGALHRVIDRAPVLSDDVVAALEVSAAEIALGTDLSALKPETERWVTPTQIAKRWGVSPQKVGRVISALGLRGDERFSKRVLTKAKHVDRIVVSFLYNALGEELIDGVLGGDGDPKDAA